MGTWLTAGKLEWVGKMQEEGRCGGRWLWFSENKVTAESEDEEGAAGGLICHLGKSRDEGHRWICWAALWVHSKSVCMNLRWDQLTHVHIFLHLHPLHRSRHAIGGALDFPVFTIRYILLIYCPSLSLECNPQMDVFFFLPYFGHHFIPHTPTHTGSINMLKEWPQRSSEGWKHIHLWPPKNPESSEETETKQIFASGSKSKEGDKRGAKIITIYGGQLGWSGQVIFESLSVRCRAKIWEKSTLGRGNTQCKVQNELWVCD